MKPVAASFAVIVSLTVMMLLFACGFVHDEHLIGPYRLIAVDVSKQMNISYSLPSGDAVGRISETVFAYGFDDKYIVAKQHPNGNKVVTHFYYLQMAKDSELASPEASVVGPLSESEFSRRQAELKLPRITRTIKSLE